MARGLDFGTARHDHPGDLSPRRRRTGQALGACLLCPKACLWNAHGRRSRDLSRRALVPRDDPPHSLPRQPRVLPHCPGAPGYEVAPQALALAAE